MSVPRDSLQCEAIASWRNACWPPGARFVSVFTQLWRVPSPSRYDNIVFRRTCDDAMIETDDDALKPYTSNHVTVRLIVWLLKLRCSAERVVSLINVVLG